MKARLLRKLLNNTAYSISNHDGYIAVGSPLCHDLISVSKEKLKLSYALDTYRQGRECFTESSQKSESTELLFIWDKLTELIKNGEIMDIINGRDFIENPLPVFTVVDGELVESVTDAYGWPNTDDNGICMYKNTHFSTKEQAIEYGIRKYEADIDIGLETVKQIEGDLLKLNMRLEKHRDRVSHLRSLQLSE